MPRSCLAQESGRVLFHQLPQSLAGQGSRGHLTLVQGMIADFPGFTVGLMRVQGLAEDIA